MKTRKRTTAAIAAMTMALSSILLTAMPLTVHAGSTWSKFGEGVTTLGTSVIGAPSNASSNTTWTGNYVYYGKYNSNSVKYRVLDPASTDFKDADDHTKTLNTLFLDCDSILTTGAYGQTYQWQNCTLLNWLNGTKSTDFLNSSNFTNIEKNAIPIVYRYYTEDAISNYKVINVAYDKQVFVLDIADVTNTKYGYADSSTKESKTRSKSDSQNWWLRSRKNSSAEADKKIVGTIQTNGNFSGKTTTDSYGYSPAFNVLRDSIVFTSKVNPDNEDTYGNEYKLTLKDTGFGIDVTTDAYVTANGSTVTVPYTVTDTDEKLDPDTVSVLIQSKTDNSIIYYAPLSGTYAASGTGTFTLPSSLDIDDWGTDYTVSILAEDVNGQYETDYASAPVEIGVSKHGVSVSAASNGTVAADKTENVIAGNTVTLTVTPDEGYAVKSVKYNDTVIEPVEGVYSFTMPAEDVTVSAEFVEPVTYLDENGVEQTLTDYKVLTGEEQDVDGRITLAGGTYVVNSDINYGTDIYFIEFTSDTTLILCDGKTMTATFKQAGNAYGVDCNGTLTICGQSGGTGKLDIYAYNAPICAENITINGGVIIAKSCFYSAIYAHNIILNGGTVNATGGADSDYEGIRANNDVILGGAEVTVNQYDVLGTVQVKEGLAYKDEDGNLYYGKLTGDQVSTLAGKTLTIADSAPVTYVDINENSTPRLLYFQPTGGDGYVADTPYLDGYTYTGMSVNGTFCENMAAVVTEAKKLLADEANAEITIAVVYEQDTRTKTVNVTGGTINGGVTSDTIQVSTLVTATAGTIDGKHFSHWTRNGVTVSYNPTYSFFMPSEAVELEAVFVDSPVTAEGTAIIESVNMIEQGKVAFVSVLNVPENCKMVKGGLVATSHSTVGENVDDEHYEYLKISDKTTENTKNLKYTWTKSNITGDTVWYVRAYLVYTDSEGVEQTIYSNAVKANKDGKITE